MKRLAIALAILLSADIAGVAEPELKRPRDGYLQAGPVDQDTAAKIIAAIESYQKILASKDYKRFYQECVHSSLKKRLTEDQFAAQISTVSEILGKFFDDVKEAYAKKGSRDVDFQIGTMSSDLVPGSVMVQFADRIDAKPKVRWPQGAPLRIEMAENEGHLRFYDID